MITKSYPKLPLPAYINLTGGLPGRAVVEYYTEDQMREYVDIDRNIRKHTEQDVQEIFKECEGAAYPMALEAVVRRILGVKS